MFFIKDTWSPRTRTKNGTARLNQSSFSTFLPVNMVQPGQMQFRYGIYGRNGHVENQNWIASGNPDPFFFFLQVFRFWNGHIFSTRRRACCVSSASGSELDACNLPASDLETIFSFWVCWTYSIPIRLWKKRSGSEVFFMFGVICIIFHLDETLLCKTCPPVVWKRFSVAVCTERARFWSASGKRDQGQGHFFMFGFICIAFIRIRIRCKWSARNQFRFWSVSL